MWAIGGGALVYVSRSISVVSAELGQAAFPLSATRDFNGVSLRTTKTGRFQQSPTFGQWWPRCVWARCRSSRSPRRRPRPARGWSCGVLGSWPGSSGSSLAVSPVRVGYRVKGKSLRRSVATFRWQFLTKKKNNNNNWKFRPSTLGICRCLNWTVSAIVVLKSPGGFSLWWLRLTLHLRLWPTVTVIITWSVLITWACVSCLVMCKREKNFRYIILHYFQYTILWIRLKNHLMIALKLLNCLFARVFFSRFRSIAVFSFCAKLLSRALEQVKFPSTRGRTAPTVCL